MVSSRRPLSSCYAGEVRVKQLPPACLDWLLVTPVASRWLGLVEGCEVEIGDGFERLGRGAVAQAVWQHFEPSGILGLQRQQFDDRIAPTLGTATAIG